MIGNPLRRLLARLFGPKDWHADPEFIARLQAEAQSRHGIAGERRDELAAELLADGSISPTQHARMVGKPELVAPRPTPFVRKLRGVK